MVKGKKKRRFMCPDCMSSFTREDNLRRHRKVICGKPNRPYVCGICRIVFKQRDDLKKHRAGPDFHTVAMYAERSTNTPGTWTGIASLNVRAGEIFNAPIAPTPGPRIKILKVEDLKNDDIVARIKKELASSHNLQPKTPCDKSKCTVILDKVVTKHSPQIKQECEELSKFKQEALEAPKDVKKFEGGSTKEVPQRSESISNWKEAKRGIITKERRKKFMKLVEKGLPLKGDKKEQQCYRPLNELPKQKDQIRCPLCGVLFNREVYAVHEFLCQGKNKKSKFGCINCSYTDCNLKELEAHVLKEHATRTSSSSS
ncbi:uncharacterized protein [Euwallacea fornicatus]|uniref:uncharacterized protein n=1 Tax=Euwallacea fornicatus TaxID=995702 RepID=UPI00338ECD99